MHFFRPNYLSLRFIHTHTQRRGWERSVQIQLNSGLMKMQNFNDNLWAWVTKVRQHSPFRWPIRIGSIVLSRRQLARERERERGGSRVVKVEAWCYHSSPHAKLTSTGAKMWTRWMWQMCVCRCAGARNKRPHSSHERRRIWRVWCAGEDGV